MFSMVEPSEGTGEAMSVINVHSASKINFLGKELRRSGINADSMEQAAHRITNIIYNYFYDDCSKERSVILTRLFKTHPLDLLPSSLQRIASGFFEENDIIEGNTQCLTLLGSTGDEDAWNTPRTSSRHQSIPLLSRKFISSLPMISGLINQLGITIEGIIHPHARISVEDIDQCYNVFFVAQALGSPLIPAQESFVIPHRVRSVIGFGGILPSRSVFAVILFLRHPITPGDAQLFRPLARNVKAALIPFESVVFDIAQRGHTGESVPQQKVTPHSPMVGVLEDILIATEETSRQYEHELHKANDQLRVINNELKLNKIQLEHSLVQEKQFLSYQRVINKLYEISFSSLSLDEQMNLALTEILTVPGLFCQLKAAIFLADKENETLNLTANHGFGSNFIYKCKFVPYGQCLCGQVAISRKITFVAHDRRQQEALLFDDGDPHGHYIIPLATGDELHGILTLYLDHSHQENEQEKHLLQGFSNTLSSMIKRARHERTLVYSNKSLQSLISKNDREISRITHNYEEKSEALKQLNINFFHLFQLVPNALALVSHAGVILNLNARFVQIFGYNNNDIPTMAECWEKWFPDPDYRFQVIHQWYISVLRAMEDKIDIPPHEYQITCKNGKAITTEISGAAFGDSILATFFDITERKQADAIAKKAKDRAETASKAKSEFLATMSHEIRTPMNGVLGMADLILKTNLTVKQRHYAETIHRSGRILLRIIDDILDFSKIQSGRLLLESFLFDLEEVVQDISTMLMEKIGEKGLDFNFNIADNVIVHLIGDSNRLSQILFNLIGNAVKFTEAGSVNLSVGVQEEGEDDILLLFKVTDTGIGISPGYQNKLFEAFTQEDPSFSRRFGGTGLGLAISGKLVALMGGTIGFESLPSQGSTFWFTTRFAKQKTTDPIQTLKPSGSYQRHMVETICLNSQILVVEDNPTNQQVISAVLEMFGCHVTIANNGQEALDTFCTIESSFDAILMDCEMPILNGMESSKRMREWEGMHAQRRTPIIALTAHVSEKTRMQCISAGMDDYLRKPVNFDRLHAVLIRHLPQSNDHDTGGKTSSDSFFHTALPSNTVLDRSVLDPIMALGKKSGTFPFKKIVQVFLNRTPELLIALKDALKQSDSEKVRTSAHALKSSCLTMGVVRLAELGEGMEKDYADLSLVHSYFLLTNAAFSEARKALNQLVEVEET